MSQVVKYKLEEAHKLYLPNVLLLQPFQQTFGGSIVRHYNSFSIRYKREKFKLSDGEVIALDWYCGEPLAHVHMGYENEDIKPIALFVADVREDIQSPDLKLMIPMAFESGYRCVVLNYRGCGNMKLKYPRLVSLYDVQDTEEVVNYLKSKTNAFKCLVAIGFGFGGNQIINYLIKI
ncbi:abhydrolase domain-containing protein 3-like protein, partial [Leptotrombidium deliense]